MIHIPSIRRGYVKLDASADAAASRSKSNAKTPSTNGYVARLRVLVAPITMVGGIATLAALNLPQSAVAALTSSDSVQEREDQDNALAKTCLKGVIYGLTLPLALVCAVVCFAVTVAAHLVCVPYAVFASAPWAAPSSTDAQKPSLSRQASFDD